MIMIPYLGIQLRPTLTDLCYTYVYSKSEVVTYSINKNMLNLSSALLNKHKSKLYKK